MRSHPLSPQTPNSSWCVAGEMMTMSPSNYPGRFREKTFRGLKRTASCKLISKKYLKMKTASRSDDLSWHTVGPRVLFERACSIDRAACCENTAKSSPPEPLVRKDLVRDRLRLSISSHCPDNKALPDQPLADR